MGQHGQSDVPVPALPEADLVVIQPALALGGLESLLNLPALSSHTHKSLQCGLACGRVKPIVGMLGLFFDTAPYQQTVAPAILFPTADQSPVVKPLAFAARACGNA